MGRRAAEEMVELRHGLHTKEELPRVIHACVDKLARRDGDDPEGVDV